MSELAFLSLVLPCRNQADHIESILHRYLVPLESLGLPFELIVVPNASTDDTVQVVEQLGRRDPRFRVVYNPEGGWGRSVRLGLEQANGQVLAYTNTARTDPEGLPLFVKRHLEQPNALVKAKREQRNARWREVGSMLYNLENRLLFGLETRDINGTPKVLSRSMYQALRLTANGDLVDLELLVQVVRQQLPVIEVPTIGFRRHGGKSSTTLHSAWKMYSGALRLWATTRWAA